MSTKVKGDAIKESSIPFSALADSLQKEINAKYGLSGYVGSLSSSNTIIESSDSMLYLYINGKVYNNMSSEDIIIANGPTVILKFKSYGYKTVVEIKEGASTIDYYGEVPVFNKHNPIPKEIPDWNAKENEDGYIQNRPFYDEYIEYTPVEKDGEYIYYLYIWSTDDDYYRNSTVEYYDPPMGSIVKYTMEQVAGGIILDLGYQCIYFHSYFDEDEGCVCVKVRYENTPTYNGPIDERVLSSIKFKAVGSYLPSRYLQNTVLKTTPQSLSDNDKNQALANLGIDPIIWKYICNPFVIRIKDGKCYVPEELVNLDSLFYSMTVGEEVYTWKYLNPAMYIGYDGMDGFYATPTYDKDPDSNVPTLNINDSLVFIDKEFKVIY